MKKNSASAAELFQYKILMTSAVNLLVLSIMSGIQGAGYLGISLAVFVFFVAYHSIWLSAMVAKYIRGRNARGQYKSGFKFFKGSIYYVLITGSVFSVALVAGSNQLGAFLFRDTHINICLIVVAVLFFVYALSEALNGYLQGMGFFAPVKISCTVRQAVCFVCSIAGMKLFSEYGKKVARLKHNEAVTSVYSAFGSLLGILVGSITGLILLGIFCLLLRGEFYTMRKRDNARYQESSFHGFRVTLTLGILQGVRYAVLVMPLLLNYILYVRLCKGEGDSTPWIKEGGYLFGVAVPFMALLLTAFFLINHKNYRQLISSWKTEAYGEFRERAFTLFLSMVVIVLPVCLTVTVMAEPLLKCLAVSASKTGVNIVMYAAIGAFLLMMEIIAVKLLELWKEVIYSPLTILVSFVAQTVFTVLLFQMAKPGAAGILFGVIVQASVFTIMFFAKAGRRLRISGEGVKRLVMALIVTVASALIMFLIYQFAGKNLPAGAAVAVSVLPGILLHLAAVTLLHIVDEEEAEQMAGGGLFLFLNGLIHR